MRMPFGRKVANNFNEYLTLLVSLMAICGGVIYYVYALNWLGIIIAIILTIVLLLFYRRNYPGDFLHWQPLNLNKKDFGLLGAYGLTYLIMVIILLVGRSDRALISPWQVVNYIFFCFYGLASFFLILILNKEKIAPGLKIVLLSSYYFISFSVALIIYKILYGFDPFIHQATMELIASKGVVLPKPPYYLGQYGLIVIISKISGLSIYFLNKILVPVLSACLLPSALYCFLSSGKESEIADKTNTGNNSIFLTILFLLILGSSLFTLTTPQNLSYLFLILTVLAGLSRRNLGLVSLLAITTAVIHPLTGLPALSWLGWLIYKKYQNHLEKRGQKISRIMIWLFTALALPSSLFLAGGGNFRNLTANWLTLVGAVKKLGGTPGSAGREDLILNLIYFIAANYSLLLLLSLIFSLFYFYRQTQKQNRDIITGLIFINSGLLAAYLLSSQIHFTDLIDYEQTAYAERIPIIIVIFFLPFLIIGLRQFITKIRQGQKLEQTLWLIFGLIILTSSLYLSYPRFDKYWNSRGYSTSASDLAAVKSVDQDAEKPYLALANQQVSAAALEEFGFNHYYQTAKGLLYFYPIPTGGPLYQYYLNMVYKNPSQSNLQGACDLAGENLIYLIINKYWYQSSRLINEAKLAADKWWTVNNEVYIFKYHCLNQP